MMFLNKRQSQDSALRKWIINHTAGNNLWMSSYSAQQFQDHSCITVDDDYQSKAGANDYCFIEDRDYTIDDVSEIILCHWNRQYQATKFFEVDLKEAGYKKYRAENIVGTSHEKITIEMYKRDLK